MKATVARVRRSYWMGPVLLHDEATPYPHAHFPYVPFFGYREDMTRVPFGLVRDMMFPQDNLNSTQARLRWGMMAVRTERTKGAVEMTDAQLRKQVGSLNADIVLNAAHMAQPGAKFDVKRDFQLNDQQFQLMQDSRMAVERVSGVTAAMQGQSGSASSGLQEQTQLEQSQVAIAALMDNFKDARSQVGELLIALIIEDMGQEEETVVIEGDTINPPRAVVLNQPEIDNDTGKVRLNNEVQRVRLKVALEDVPSSSSFRAQQLNSLSEAIKSLPPRSQQVTMPFLIDLMDLPRKKEVVKALRDAEKTPDPEVMMEEAKKELMYELKVRELDIRETEAGARGKLMQAQTVQTGVQSSFSAMQAGTQVAQMPQIAPVADAIMASAGYRKPIQGDDPNFPTADVVPPMPPQGLPDGPMAVRQNTSPSFPPVPDDGTSPMTGIETADTHDNLEGV